MTGRIPAICRVVWMNYMTDRISDRGREEWWSGTVLSCQRHIRQVHNWEPINLSCRVVDLYDRSHPSDLSCRVNELYDRSYQWLRQRGVVFWNCLVLSKTYMSGPQVRAYQSVVSCRKIVRQVLSQWSVVSCQWIIRQIISVTEAEGSGILKLSCLVIDVYDMSTIESSLICRVVS